MGFNQTFWKKNIFNHTISTTQVTRGCDLANIVKDSVSWNSVITIKLNYLVILLDRSIKFNYWVILLDEFIFRHNRRTDFLKCRVACYWLLETWELLFTNFVHCMRELDFSTKIVRNWAIFLTFTFYFHLFTNTNVPSLYGD